MMQTEIVFPASRLKALLLLAGSCAFVAIGILMAREKPLIGWASVMFFGLGIPLSILMLLPNKVYLRLDPRGFEIGSPFSKKLTRWKDVERFYIGAVRGARLIAIVYRPGYSQQQALRKVSSKVAGMEGAIPNSYAASREEVLKALNEWHARHAGE
jgi:hypothetical protein